MIDWTGNCDNVPAIPGEHLHGYHPHKNIHIISGVFKDQTMVIFQDQTMVVFQDQTIYARKHHFKGAKLFKIWGEKKVFFGPINKILKGKMTDN